MADQKAKSDFLYWNEMDIPTWKPCRHFEKPFGMSSFPSTQCFSNDYSFKK